jgi:hypothetical protein
MKNGHSLIDRRWGLLTLTLAHNVVVNIALEKTMADLMAALSNCIITLQPRIKFIKCEVCPI